MPDFKRDSIILCIDWQIILVNIILVSDVFGVTPALLKLKEALGANDIIDPYNGKSMEFTSEAQAYTYFTNEVGHDSYVTILSETLLLLDVQVVLIGFSAGATAIWRQRISNEKRIIKQAFGFYASQIRNFTHIEPYFKITLIFPRSELHFDVSMLKQDVEKKQNVNASQVEYLHGFMNGYSNHFSQRGYDEHLAMLNAQIR